MTEDQLRQRKNYNNAGLGMLGTGVLLLVLLTVLDPGIDPGFTRPVFFVLFIGAAGFFGAAHKIKREAKNSQ